ncbi:AraC family transcriptional regulator [Sciscionella marina]|uniref:AraC family transcriptional regulator n=1 Tax=Sciscionella marina TaxID=508770 RepID=UPI00037DA3CD|nr:helix-turn-helix domain-containing protein [Sciscionella marina]
MRREPQRSGVQWLVVSTGDLDRARSIGERAFFPHHLIPVDQDGRESVGMRLRACEFGPEMTVGAIEYGAAVRLDCGRLETGYQVNIPLSGRVDTRCGDQRLIASPSTAAVYTPDLPSVIDRWNAGCAQIGIRFSREVLERDLTELLNRPLRGSIAFEHALDLSDAAARSWVGLAQSVFDLGSTLPPQRCRRIADSLTRTLLTSFLHTARHEYRDELDAERPIATSRVVRTAVRFIEEHLDEPVDVLALARVCGVSVRALQNAFARELGLSPTAYRRARALESAHRDLVNADPAHRTVTEIATRWGFHHLGRFARDYRRRFGDLPVATLHDQSR